MQIKSLFASNVNAHSACNYRTLSPLRPDTTDVSVGQCSEGCGRCTLYHWTHWGFLESVLFDWYYNCFYHIKRSKIPGKVLAFWKINQQSPYTLKHVHSNFLVVLIKFPCCGECAQPEPQPLQVFQEAYQIWREQWGLMRKLNKCNQRKKIISYISKHTTQGYYVNQSVHHEFVFLLWKDGWKKSYLPAEKYCPHFVKCAKKIRQQYLCE